MRPPVLSEPRTQLVHAVSSHGSTAGSGDEFVEQLDDFITAARTKRPPFVTVEQGQSSLRLIDQLYSRRRSHVAVPEPVR